MMYKRPELLNFLHQFKDKEVIKVLTGVRRAGKSKLFELYIEQLRSEGVQDSNIININFESLEFEDLKDYKKLNHYILERVDKRQKNYVFLDEIQHVEKYELVVDSLYIEKYIDLYITGSNSYFMSGELATLLSGRYVEREVLPLSFKEYCSMFEEDVDKGRVNELYSNYMVTQFPYATQLPKPEQRIYLEGIMDSVVLKDISQRLGNVSTRLIERIIKFLMGSLGKQISLRNIAGYLTSTGEKATVPTVDKYLDKIVDSLLFYPVQRYNIKGKESLLSLEKYYTVDMGLRGLMVDDRSEDLGVILENLVYLELRRRGYQIYVGQIDGLEIDFVAINTKSEKLYIQVAWNTETEATLKRELAPLQLIKDHHPKLILTMDTIKPRANYDGIQKLPVLLWFLGE